jgi:hypothetical protein
VDQGDDEGEGIQRVNYAVDSLTIASAVSRMADSFVGDPNTPDVWKRLGEEFSNYLFDELMRPSLMGSIEERTSMSMYETQFKTNIIAERGTTPFSPQGTFIVRVWGNLTPVGGHPHLVIGTLLIVRTITDSSVAAAVRHSQNFIDKLDREPRNSDYWRDNLEAHPAVENDDHVFLRPQMNTTEFLRTLTRGPIAQAPATRQTPLDPEIVLNLAADSVRDTGIILSDGGRVSYKRTLAEKLIRQLGTGAGR